MHGGGAPPKGPSRRAGRSALWIAALLLLTLVAAGLESASAASPGADDASEPWRREANQDRDAELRGRLTALENAREAEAEAAAREKSIGGEKLKDADAASAQAAAFMTKAEKLLASEDNLKEEEGSVKARLDALEKRHKNIKLWSACNDGSAECAANHKDTWGPDALEPADDSVTSVLRRHQKRAARSRGRKGDDDVNFDASSPGTPYSAEERTDSKPAVDWKVVKNPELRAGYDLSNCFVAAEKDKSTVQVEIMDKRKFIITEKGCRCMIPFPYYKFAGYGDNGEVYEESEVTHYDRCSKNGSKKGWCATTANCGYPSEDIHAGLGEGDYGWTHWDYCTNKRQTKFAPVWSATHSAGDVTCLADYLLASDRAAEWRALELLRQEPEREGQVAPAEVASRYEKCIARASSASSAVFCEADMLHLLPPSVVRHALLISRSDSMDVHWANRQRVVLLYAKQLQGCLAAAQGAEEGTVCIAQLLSSLPAAIGRQAVANGLDAQESGEAPEEVSTLTARLVSCVRAASNDDALAFCAASFLTHAPRRVVRHAAQLARRVRSFGSAGFPDTTGLDNGVGWVGFKHPLQVTAGKQ